MEKFDWRDAIMTKVTSEGKRKILQTLKKSHGLSIANLADVTGITLSECFSVCGALYEESKIGLTQDGWQYLIPLAAKTVSKITNG